MWCCRRTDAALTWSQLWKSHRLSATCILVPNIATLFSSIVFVTDVEFAVSHGSKSSLRNWLNLLSLE